MNLTQELQLNSLRRFVGVKYSGYIKNTDYYFLNSLSVDLDTLCRNNSECQSLQNLPNKFREVIGHKGQPYFNDSLQNVMSIITNINSEEVLYQLLYLIEPLLYQPTP